MVFGYSSAFRMMVLVSLLVWDASAEPGRSRIRRTTANRLSQPQLDKPTSAVTEQLRSALEEIGKQLKDQDHVLRAFEAIAGPYLEEMQERASRAASGVAERIDPSDKDIPSFHMIGFPGTGKSKFMELLAKKGLFQVIVIDCQNFSSNHPSVVNQLDNFFANIERLLQISPNEPTIFLFDELEKAREIGPDRMESTIPIIGALNQLLTNGGTIHFPYNRYHFPNVMVVSAMNTDTRQILSIHRQLAEKADRKRSFFDLTEDDLQQLNSEFLGVNRRATIAKLLEPLFRPNTISRIAESGIVTRPLEQTSHAEIAREHMMRQIARLTRDPDKRLNVVEPAPEFFSWVADAIRARVLGARPTRVASQRMILNLLSIAQKIPVNGEMDSLGRPLTVRFALGTMQDCLKLAPIPKGVSSDSLDSKCVLLTLESQAYQSDRTTKQIIPLYYSRESASFFPPAEMIRSVNLPSTPTDLRPVLRASNIRDTRRASKHSGAQIMKFVDEMKQTVAGQDEILSRLAPLVVDYDSVIQSGRTPERPTVFSLMGFPGLGKSLIARALAFRYEQEEPVSVLLSQVSAEDASVESWVRNINYCIPDHGPFVLVFDDLHLIRNIKSGIEVDRPILTLLRELLNKGHFQYTTKDSGTITVDIRRAFSILTLNLDSPIFLHGDPRLTTIEDTWSAYAYLNLNTDTIRSSLLKVFDSSTVDRLLMNPFEVVPPLRREDFEEIVYRAFNTALDEYFGNIDAAAIHPVVTETYLAYLYQETVIPGIGARSIPEQVGVILKEQLSQSFRPNRDRRVTERFLDTPLTLTFDYNPRGQKVTIRARTRGLSRDSDYRALRGRMEPPGVHRTLFSEEITPRFIDPVLTAAVPERRLATAVHEAGHALASMLFGIRFDQAECISIRKGTMGAVSPSANNVETGWESLGAHLVGDFSVVVAARAMERFLKSDNPMDPASAMLIAEGVEGDQTAAGKILWDLLFRSDFDPDGGSLAIPGRAQQNHGENPYVAALGENKTQSLRRLSRKVEDYLINLFSGAIDKEWLKPRILTFARKGILSENEMRELFGFPPVPRGEKVLLSSMGSMESIFGAQVVTQRSPEVQHAIQAKWVDGKTASQRLEELTQFFLKELKALMHSPAGCNQDVLEAAQAGTPGKIALTH